MRRILTSIFLAFMLSVACLRPAVAIEYGGIGGIPANPDPANPRTKSIFVYSLGPNGSKSDGLRVVNNTPDTKTIEVYPTDSEVSSGGSFACKQKVEDRKDVGAWISFESSEVTLQPNTNQVVPFTLTMPGQADVGEHDGCIVVQDKTQETKAAGNGIVLGVRSALRVVVTVPGEIKKDLQITGLKVAAAGSKHRLTVAMKNNGNVSLDADIFVTVKNVFGKQAYRNGGTYPVLAQKQPYELNFEMDHSLWGGIYHAAASATYNSDPKVSIGQTGGQTTTRYSESKMFIVSPKPLGWLVYAVLLGAVAAGLWFLARRRRQTRDISATWESYTIKKHDTLHKLADSRQASWQLVAKVNNLKPPYVLEPGATLQLPPAKPKSTPTEHEKPQPKASKPAKRGKAKAIKNADETADK